MNQEHIEIQEAKAEAAIDWIDTLPDRIELLLLEGCYKHDFNISKTATSEAMALIEEALNDLFHKDRGRLQEISGYTPKPKRIITNPATLIATGAL